MIFSISIKKIQVTFLERFSIATRSTISFSLFFVCVFLLSSPSTARSFKVKWKKIQVLVYTKNGKGYVHDNIPFAVEAMRKLGKDNGFKVDVSDDPSVFTEENLGKYNALIFTSTNNEVFDNDSQKVAFMRYVQAGGGFLGIHSVTGTERKWEWFKRLVGGTFVRHAKQQVFAEVVVDKKHPSTVHLPDQWKNNDECYYVTTINPDLHVVLAHDLTTVDDPEKPLWFGNSYPSAWYHEWDGGRQFYTALGHEGAMYSDPVFMKHILGGLQWVVAGNRKPDFKLATARSSDDPLPY
ncbi:MAG: ThuA domain-containing protein [Chitinophagaceae bacterium]|nr:MAG: ThuA domain-containing protein [Chitinophagaceae bacterium]